jgi:hypothetical protein
MTHTDTPRYYTPTGIHVPSIHADATHYHMSPPLDGHEYVVTARGTVCDRPAVAILSSDITGEVLGGGVLQLSILAPDGVSLLRLAGYSEAPDRGVPSLVALDRAEQAAS